MCLRIGSGVNDLYRRAPAQRDTVRLARESPTFNAMHAGVRVQVVTLSAVILIAQAAWAQTAEEQEALEQEREQRLIERMQEQEELDRFRIRDCYEGRHGCIDEQRAYWFYVYGPPQSEVDSPSAVIRIGRDRAASLLALDSPLVPEKVRKDAQPKPRELKCWSESFRSSVQPCPFPEFQEGDAEYHLMPLGLLGIQRGRYQVYQPPLPQADAAELAAQVQYGVPVGNEQGYVLESQASGASPAQLGPYLRVKQQLYIGLLGGFSEGYGALGGLAIFDLGKAAWKVHRPSNLLEVHVTDMVMSEGALWMGTAHFAEHGVIGMSGLVRFDRATAEFSSYTTGTSPIPGNVVWMVRKYRAWYTPPDQTALLRSLWVATERGIALFTPESGNWERWILERDPEGKAPFRIRYTPTPPGSNTQTDGEQPSSDPSPS